MTTRFLYANSCTLRHKIRICQLLHLTLNASQLLHLANTFLPKKSHANDNPLSYCVANTSGVYYRAFLLAILSISVSSCSRIGLQPFFLPIFHRSNLVKSNFDFFYLNRGFPCFFFTLFFFFFLYQYFLLFHYSFIKSYKIHILFSLIYL